MFLHGCVQEEGLLQMAAADQERGEGTVVHVRLVDASTGKTTPAMVCITSRDDGSVRLPPDGRILKQPSTEEEFVAGFRFDPDPNWIGPVGSHMAFLPYWKEEAIYMTSGNFSILLPKGTWRISVARGTEYVPVVYDYETQGEGSLEVHLTLERWINLANMGWFSGDVHVHHPNLNKGHQDFIRQP